MYSPSCQTEGNSRKRFETPLSADERLIRSPGVRQRVIRESGLKHYKAHSCHPPLRCVRQRVIRESGLKPITFSGRINIDRRTSQTEGNSRKRFETCGSCRVWHIRLRGVRQRVIRESGLKLLSIRWKQLPSTVGQTEGNSRKRFETDLSRNSGSEEAEATSQTEGNSRKRFETFKTPIWGVNHKLSQTEGNSRKRFETYWLFRLQNPRPLLVRQRVIRESGLKHIFVFSVTASEPLVRQRVIRESGLKQFIHVSPLFG